MTRSKRIIGLLLLLAIFLLVDQKLFRCHFLSKVAARPQWIDTNKLTIKGDYIITEIKGKGYQLSIYNSSLFPRLLLGYRSDKICPDFGPSEIIELASRVKISTQNIKIKVNEGFTCGTGLGILSFNSFEQVSKNISYNEFFDGFDLLDIVSNREDIYYDLIYDQPLIIPNREGYVSLIDDHPLTPMDSLDIQLYMPVYSIFTGEQYFICSNKIRVSYLDLLLRALVHAY